MISGHWTWPGEEGQEHDVFVWHNCDEIRLYHNDVEIEPADSDLNHWKIPYAPGELKAVGKRDGITVTDFLTTAGNPAKIVVSSAATELLGDGFDAVPVFAEINDSNGVVVPVNFRQIEFSVEGPGRIVGIGGDYSSQTADGNAAILVQSSGDAGIVRITAESGNLEPGSVEIIATSD